ncbi:MAG TPA: tRNA (guanosine(46)-N7)-methyltransferase TrmB [Roseiarcus sp.]
MANAGPDGSTPLRRLYGRSRGKALRVGQERLLAEALPLFSITPEALAAGQAFASPQREMWLEIGFGAGEHLIEQAKANPDVDVVGCEPFLNGVAAALAGLKREQLFNVRLRRGDVQALVDAAPDGFFSRVFILYPDPWPKRRHHKRRVVAVDMIEGLARVMRRGAEVRFATDVDDYAGWTLKRFLASPNFRWTANRADDWRRPWPEWRPTRYEAKARKEGRGSVYLTFARL